jgi:hypothetical protein
MGKRRLQPVFHRFKYRREELALNDCGILSFFDLDEKNFERRI